MKCLVIFLGLVSAVFAGVIQAPIAAGPAKVIVNTGASSQYRSQDSTGNYAFGYNEEHATGGTFRREQGNALGQVVGSYGLRDADGRVRVVNYVADDDGFRADINTNEPGVEPRSPAAATINKPATLVTQAAAVAPATVVATPIVTGPAPHSLVAPAPIFAAAATKTIAAAPIIQQQIVEQRHLPPTPVQFVQKQPAAIVQQPIVEQQIVQQPIVEQQLVHHQPIVEQQIVQHQEQPIVQAPIAQQVYTAPVKTIAPPVVQYQAPIQKFVQQAPLVESRPVFQAPIVQQKVVEQIVEQRPAQPYYVEQQPIVQQQFVESRPIVQQRYQAPLPVVQQAPVYQTKSYAGPALTQLPAYQAPLAPARYVAPVAAIKGQHVGPSVYASPARLVTAGLKSQAPIIIGQDSQNYLELASTYAHPAAYGYTLGMPSTWGYTYVLRRKK